MPPTASCVGATLQGSGVRDQFGLIVIAIKKPDDSMQFNPTADTHIDAGDRLVLIGPADALRAIEQRMRG